MARRNNIARRKVRKLHRAKPGSSGGGGFFHIEVRPRTLFVAFRNQDVGSRGGIERIAGRRADGSWATQKWLIGKAHAHLLGDRLIADSADARKVLNSLGSKPVHLGADRFRAEPHRNIPESKKPTPAQRRAWARNIKKAQAARHKR